MYQHYWQKGIERKALRERRKCAEAEGLPLRCQEADAEQLPFADGSFDVVLSTFGAMFAPDDQQVAVRR